MARSCSMIAVLVLGLVLAMFVGASSVSASPPDSSNAEAPAAESQPEPASESTIEIDERGYVVVPTPSAKAEAWYRSGMWLWAFRTLWSLLVPALILWFGVSATLRDKSEAWTRKPWQGVLLFLLAYAVLVFVIDLPLSYYASYVRPHAYGLSEQTLGKWFGDQFKGLVLALVGLWLFIPGALWLIRKSPERWWLWASVLAIPIAFALLMLLPVFIAPLFNDFGPMKDASLEAEILALAERAGIEGSRVFEVEKSVDTKTVNAYVTGFWSTKRIVLWDTIIARLERDELLVVMGHEMGHYVLGHVRNSMALALVSIPLTLGIFHWLATKAIARFGERFGFDSLADVAALPLLILIIGLLAFVGQPIANVWSRHQEHESDRFALEITRDNQGCARAFARLQQSNLGNPRPGPIYRLWRASHPALGERIDFCNEYRPWESGEARRYEHLFQ